MEQAAALLVSPAGDPAAEYLLRRGLRPETWEAWGLGYTLAAWDNRLKAARPAILIPWQYREVTALKYRFLTVPAGGLRYTSKAGSEHIAFGLNLAGGHYATLWLVEGELNAVSLWQALREAHMVNFDVLSFGGESKATRLDPALQRWAGRYQQVIVWADEPAKAAAAMAAIPGAFGLRSPVVDGRKLDANELLLLGGLADFARAAWARFDQDPAHVARIRAELEGAGWGGLAPSL
ncbi:MAG: hypothetical protein BWY52_01791 [Chloroflexi bacterium ADurb.Bin325]|nr:MAG: hypothetical protein BWY52_01791 [Chloroflexi bacterium ADurb.Bin325]